MTPEPLASDGPTASFYGRVLAEQTPNTVEPLLRPTPAWVLDPIAALRPCVPKSALDIGYGAGVIALDLAHHGFDVVAVDQVPVNLFEQRWRNHPQRCRVSVIQTPLEMYEDSASYGVVVALDVLHYLSTSSVRRLLGGLIALAPSGALHLLQVFTDINRTDQTRGARLGAEAGFTLSALTSVLDDLYRDWETETHQEPYLEQSEDQQYRFSATRVKVVAVSQ
jgi:2-polyprenyl-3-methyl-5-hydroxy-6-metoxy-1,4-benzoquinol methylase